MKKYILSTLFVLSISISFSQLITHTSVRVDDSERESYLELEEFWSKIHEQAIKDEYSDGWMLWEFTYKDDEEAEGKPDFLIMNFHKDSLQRQKVNSIDFDYVSMCWKLFANSKKNDLILTGAYGPPIPIDDVSLIEVHSSLFGNVSANFK